MNGPGRKTDEREFERNARAMFDASIESLDARTLSRLNHARHRAVEAAATASRPARRAWAHWIPAVALAASVVLASLLLLRGQVLEPPSNETAQLPVIPEAEAVEWLAAGEDLELVAEAELDFYTWVAATDSSATEGLGG